MAAFSNSVVSAVTNLAEIQPALANLNFDFTLYKVEAPREFQGVGKSLSLLRRAEAEDGQLHVTARTLGALFGGILPSTPKLIKAYGLRASEIAKHSAAEKLPKETYGFFSSRAGTDATSIWAGATSGPEAIAVHLLACMLARMWDPPEATSIWDEILKIRRDEILANFDAGQRVHIGDVSAARRSIPRDQIAAWDASARAWLRVADQVKFSDQKQLLLIIDNLQTSVDSSDGTYKSVTGAWITALTTFEALLEGVSQKSRDAGLLVALSAWHLYPSMMILEPGPKQIDREDPLLRSCGALTVGLEQRFAVTSERSQQDANFAGIRWSLPLAYLHHYGHAVKCEQLLNSTQRLTMDEFAYVFLGAYIGSCDRSERDIECLQTTYNLLKAADRDGDQYASTILAACDEGSWLGLLLKAADGFLTASNQEKSTLALLLRLGRKYGPTFLGPEILPQYNRSLHSLFQLWHSGRFISCLKSTDEQVRVLREFAATMPAQSNQLFIRIKHGYDAGMVPVYEYATAKPRPTSDQSPDTNDGSVHRTVMKHQRWLYNGGNLNIHSRDDVFRREIFDHYWSQYYDDLSTEERSRINLESTLNSSPRCPRGIDDIVRRDFETRRTIYEAQQEQIFDRESTVIEDFAVRTRGVFWKSYASSTNSGNGWFELVYGDDTVGLYADESDETIGDFLAKRRWDCHAGNLYADTIDPHAFSETLYSRLNRPIDCSTIERMESSRWWISLQAVNTALQVYRHLPGATIDVRVLESCLCDMHWKGSGHSFSPARLKGTTNFGPISEKSISPDSTLKNPRLETPYTLRYHSLSLTKTFACICFFDSGRFNLNPGSIARVIAMSSNDKLWVASTLLRDPGIENLRESPQEPLVKVFTGNIGRPGMAFLVPPTMPMTRPYSIQDFRDVVHRPFEGHLQDMFQSTSLHLSFTSAEFPLSSSFRGMKDNEIYLLETLLSVHENGRWVADLDVMHSLDNDKFHVLATCNTHSRKAHDESQEIACIDRWSELLDLPDTNLAVVRACGNWQARLAASTIAVSSSCTTIAARGEICWQCCYQIVKTSTSENPSESNDQKVIVVA